MKRKSNILKISIFYFIALLIISFIILMFQLNYCKTNEIDLINLINETQSGLYYTAVNIITDTLGTGAPVVLMGALFGNFLYAFIIGFTITASVLLIVFISKMLLNAFGGVRD